MAHNFALVGNPNCGKTTLFNKLTGSNQKVGNWPGVTVEKKVGSVKRQGETIHITDLPGIYSLAPYSLEEIIASDYILSGASDLIINIVDATTIERSLFFTTQLMETGVPMIIALNFMDVVESDGTVIDVEGIEKSLGIPIIPISASRGYGIDDIIPIALHTLHDLHYHGECHGHREKHGHSQPHKPTEKGVHIQVHTDPQNLQIESIYSNDIQAVLNDIESILGDVPHARWVAVRYFEDGEKALEGMKIKSETLAQLEYIINNFQKTKKIDRDMILADARYTFICDIVGKFVKESRAYYELTTTDKIDRIVTNRILAIPIFLVIMFGIFWLSFGPLGSFLTDCWVNILDKFIFGGLVALFESAGSSAWTMSLINDGIIAGVATVLEFLPQIALLFLFLSLLEASGYMARAAFVMDRLFRRLGLSGKSFVPMLMGFGCTVPAIMATRMLENENERRLTIMITPFISCSARLPVYAVFAGAFFAERQPLIVFSIYLIGIIVAVLSGLFLKRFVTKGQQSNFIMELPAYRLPSIKRVWLETWEKVRGFIVRAGTIILAASVIVWILQKFDPALHMVEDSSKSMLGIIGGFIAPIFTPLGFGDWRAATALITGFIAKEAVVGTLGILYSEPLTSSLGVTFSQASAYAFMVFTLLYLPCVAAFGVLKRELNSWKWTFLTVGYQTGAAWIAGFIAYQIIRLFV